MSRNGRSRRTLRQPVLALTQLEERSVPSTTPPLDHDDHEAEIGLNAMPTSYSFMQPAGFLSGPQAGDRDSLARSVLAAYADDAGLLPADVLLSGITDSYSSQGQSHVYFRQMVNGLPVLNADAGVHFMADGRVLTVNVAYVPNLASAPGLSLTTTIGPVEAVSLVAASFEYILQSPPQLLASIGGVRQTTIVSEPEFSDLEIQVERAYVNTPRGVRPVWELSARTPDGEHWYHAAVDAVDGSVEYWADWVSHFGTYNVLAMPNESPSEGGRSVLVNPADPIASPFGWHDTDGVAGGEFTDTRGNNVRAQEDQDNNNTGGARPDGGTNRIFDFPFDTSVAPTGYIPAATTNLFYMNNVMHDVTYQYGFDEISGNFQTTNYTGSGSGNDAVEADALDGSGINNANFGTPPDGSAPRMQMYVWDPADPDRDSDFDNGVIAHEYGHGISNRLTGGPANASALSNTQSRGMGEGWSDFFALMLTQRATDQPGDRYGIGTYVINQPTTGTGIRSFPYSFDMGINPMSFADYGTGGGQNNAVHFAGARWCSALWDMNWLLIAKYGFDSNLNTGYAPGGGPASAGNKLTMQLVLDAMKIQGANPSFIQARDAILAADFALTGGQNRREIWAAFTRRGLGASATTSGSNDTNITEAYDPPTMAAAAPSVTAQSPAGLTQSTPTSLTLTFSESMDTGSFSVAADVVSFTGPGGTNLVSSITGFSWTTTTTLRIDFTAQSAAGLYTIVVGPNILAADNSAAMNQDFDSNVGESVEDRYSASFQFDPATLTVTAIAPGTGSIASVGTTTIDVTFSENVLASSLAASDLQLSQGTVTGVSLIAGNQARFTVSGFSAIGEAMIYLSLNYGAATDAAGFPSLAFNSFFILDYDTVALPALSSSTPLGSLVYNGSFGSVATIGSASDTDSFTLSLEANQRITAIVTPVAGSTLIPVITILDSGGSTVGTGTGTAGDALATTAPVASAGTYTIRVAGGSGSTGGYTVQVLLNSTTEAELYGGSSNDSTATAQSLDAAFFAPIAGISLTSVVGQTDATGVLPAEQESNNSTATANNATRNFTSGGTTNYQLGWTGTIASANNQDWVQIGTLNAGDVITITMSGNPSGAGTLGDPYLELWRAGSGSLVVEDDDSGPSVDSIIYRFSVQTTDTYFVKGRAFSSGTGTYRIGVRLENTGAAPTTGDTFQAETESNDTIGTANDASTSWRQVATTSVTTGSITGGDADFVRYTFTAGDRITVAGVGSGGFGPEIALLNSAGTVLQTIDSSTAAESTLYGYVIPTTGTYYVRVQASSGTGNYTLTVFHSGTTPPAPSASTDWYSVSLAAGETISVGLLRTTAGVASVQLLDPTGTTVLASGSAATNYTQTLTATASAAGAYRIRVSDSAPTSYQLTVARGAALDREANDTFATAQPLTAGDSAIGGLTAGNSDWYSVSIGAGNPGFRVQTSTPGDASGEFNNLLDPIIEIYTPGGLLLATDNNSGPDGRNALASVFALAAGTYRVRILAAGGTTGEYVVSTEILPNQAPINVSAGGPYSVTEGNSLTFGASANDPEGDSLTYDWDLNNDGDFSDATGPAPTLSYAALESLGLGDGPFLISVRVRVTDGYSPPVVSSGVNLTVVNAAPTGTAVNSGPVAEGSGTPTMVSVINAQDPSSVDSAAGFTYSYDFNNDGTFDLVGVTDSSVAVPAALLDDGGATRRVRIALIDKDGAATILTTDVGIANINPTSSLTGSTVLEGSTGTVTFGTVTDPSNADTAAGFTYSYDFNNDGTFEVVGTTANSATVPVSYLIEGPFDRVVRARVIDKDGGFNDYTATVRVNNANPTATFSGSTVLEGSTGTVTFSSVTDPSPVDVSAGFTFSYDFDNDGTFEVAGSSSNAATVPASYLADGPFNRVVRGRVTDKDGGYTDYTAVVQVTNANPTSSLTGSTVAEGSTGTVTFNAVADPSSDDTAAGFTYSYDFNNDGTFEITGSSSNTATVPASYLIDGPFNRVVRARVTDKDGGFNDYTAIVQVTNVNPTASLTGSTVLEGSTGTVTFGTVSDPSSVDTAAGFTYSYDFNNDGSFEIVGSSSKSATVPASYLTDGPFNRTVRARVIDKDGGFNDYTATVQVLNADPSATLTGSTVSEGNSGSVSFGSVTDPSSLDVAAGFTYSFDFDNDGTFEIVGTASKSAVVPASYLTDGPFDRVVRARVIDKDGGYGERTAIVRVNNVNPVATLTGSSVLEGNPGSVSFGPVTDPSSVDIATGFTYSYDFDNDGTFEIEGTSSNSITVPASLLNDGPFDRVVRARVIDKDGGYTERTALVRVTNVIPSATLTGTNTAEGTSGTVSFGPVTDPSSADVAAGFTYSYDFDNDGTYEITGSTSNTVAVPASYLADGPFDHVVRARVFDKDGGFAQRTAIIQVTNIAPTATLSTGGDVIVGTPTTIRFTDPVDVAADLANLTYEFDIIVEGSTTTISGPESEISYLFPDPGTYDIVGRVKDDDGGVNEYSTTAIVDNIAPSATLAGDATSEGGSATVSFSGVNHPSPSAVAAGFRYSFDFDNNGTFDLGDGTYAGSVLSPTADLPAGLLLDSGTRTVAARVVEVNGEFLDLKADVEIANTAPTATPTGPGGPVRPAQPFTIALTNVLDPSPLDTAAGFVYSFDTDDDGIFETIGSTSSVTLSFLIPGSYQITSRVEDRDGDIFESTRTVVVQPSAGLRAYAVGADAGGAPRASLHFGGATLFNNLVFSSSFTGGVRVATGDVNGDGIPDLVVGSGPGMPTLIRVISGTGSELASFAPFEPAFLGGVYIATGDMDGDGKDEIVVCPDEGGGPRVLLYRGGDLQRIASFLGIDDNAFRGGARPSLGDLNGDGRADLLVAAGFGGGPRVTAYDGYAIARGSLPSPLFNVFVFEQSLRNGVFVATGDLNGDGFADLVVGGGPGGGPRVQAFSGPGMIAGVRDQLANFFAGDDSNRGGVRVTAKYLDGDELADLVIGDGAGAGSRVKTYFGMNLDTGGDPDESYESSPGFAGGVFVG